MKASVNSIETFGLVDGPGIRTVIFLNGCKLRCLYCIILKCGIWELEIILWMN